MTALRLTQGICLFCTACEYNAQADSWPASSWYCSSTAASAAVDGACLERRRHLLDELSVGTCPAAGLLDAGPTAVAHLA
jgi:hypothetical protein